MFGLTWAQIYVVLQQHEELGAIVGDVAALLKKHRKAIDALVDAFATSPAPASHEEAVKRVAEAVRKQVSPADLALMERASSVTQGGS